jgi:PAS domain S-box-containing protein
MKSKKILAIDDTLDNLITIKAVLKSKFPNYTVLTALSGEEGIEIAKNEALHLIILDIIMPNLDGFDILKILKADATTKDIPVVLLTAIKSDADSRVKGLALGADAFLSKPIDVEKLTAYIKVVLRTHEKTALALEKTINLENLVEEKMSEIEFQATVLQNITESIISFDKAFIIQTWNKGAENMYGWTANEVIGKKFQDILKPVFFNNGYSCEIVSEQVGVLNLEALHQTKDGRTIHVAKSKSPILDKNNIAIGNICITRDITAQRQSEIDLINAKEKTEESEKLLNYFFIQSMSGVFFMMLDKPIDWNDSIDKEKTLDYIFKHQKVTKANKAILQQYGATLEQFIGNTPADFFKHNMADGRKIWSDFFDKGILHIDTHEKKFDGTDIIIEGDYKCIYNDKNQIIGHFGIQNEVTAIRYAENELNKLSTAIVQSPVSIFITNLEGTIEYANPKVTEITGYELSEIIGQNPRLFSSKEKSKDEYKELWNTLIAGKVWYGEFHNKRKNGELFWERASISPIVDKTGKTTHYLAVKEDITHQKELLNNLQLAKEKAEESKSNLIAIIENTTDSIWSINTNYEIQYVNNSFFNEFYKNFGVKLYYGVNLLQSLPDILKPVWKERYDIALNGQHFIFEDRIDIGTSHVFIEVAMNPILIGEKIIGASFHGKNITERKLNELELIKAKEKAEESDRLKSAFLANMSHEIRTPMNSILGFSELLMNDDLAVDKRAKYFEILNNNGKRLLNLINDIVDISKIDVQQFTLNYTYFNLNTLIDNLKSQFEISPLRKNISFIATKQLNDERSFIKADNTRLAQVFANLLENALKFTENGTIEIGYTTNDAEIQFFVKDSGIGINKKDQDLIFERFGQSDNHDNKAIEGTGLGLSISKGIIEAMGGKIWVESEPYKGATFYFTMPNCFTNTVPQETKEPVIIDVETIKTPTILIAEDEESNFWYIEAALENQNFKLLHAENGKEAVNMFQNNDVDLILMDFNMPIMNGVEATVEIRKTNQKIPIIALTAYAMAEDKDRAYAVGCNDFLAKPINRNLLLETIKVHL